MNEIHCLMLAPLTFLEVLLLLSLYSLFPNFFWSSDVGICLLTFLNIKPHFPCVISKGRHTQTKVIENKKYANLRNVCLVHPVKPSTLDKVEMDKLRVKN